MDWRQISAGLGYAVNGGYSLMNSKFLTRQISAIESMRLPRNLCGYIFAIGMDRQYFTDYSEWQQYCVLYKAMVALQGQVGFAILAARIIAFTEKTRPKSSLATPKPAQRLTKKERRRLGQEGPDHSPSKAERHLAKELRRAKPTPSKTIEDWNASPKIGLGIKSTMPPPPKTRRDQVKLDAHTSPPHQNDPSHILYVAGWTMAEDEN
ncbi:hypothetical protein CNN82_00135 [Pseudomonas frederiksbergensis]|uniref:Uncharacterized protein n=2 Tax=Pseudomonas frederiksbergensis TaxID=104087 RepID=A0AB33E064_9PSED|nr:hypothetical protein CNN82_00135 [Pseudomonas frederiksbergensis]